MKRKAFLTLFGILITMVLYASAGMAQNCADTIYLFDTTMVDVRQIRIPVYLGNSCEVAGFSFIFVTSAPGVLVGTAADTIGSRLNYGVIDTQLYFHNYDTTIVCDTSFIDTTVIDTFWVTPDSFYIDTLEIHDTLVVCDSTITWDTLEVSGPLYWQYFGANRGTYYPDSLFVTGLADWPDPPLVVPPLDSGYGLLFNAMFAFPDSFNPTSTIDTTVEIRIDRAMISDRYGQVRNIPYYNGQVTIHYTGVRRGDANCNGSVTGSDVTYLVGYFKGTQVEPCALRAGDANADGRINGSDVTYLVRYFKGLGPPPPP